MITIILLSIAGVVIATVLGTVWYSEKTPMGRTHMRYLGFDKLSEEEKKNKIKEAMPRMPQIYAGQMVLSLLTSAFVVLVVTTSVQNGVPFGTALVFPVLAWLCFAVPTSGSALLWSNTEKKLAWKKFFADMGLSLVTIILIALVTSFFI